MVLGEGDILQPLVIVVPTMTGIDAGKTGQLKISGAKLWVYTGSAWEIVTSA